MRRSSFSKSGSRSMSNAVAVTPSTYVSMNRTANGIKGVLETLTNQLKVLEEQIKADERDKLDFERDIGLLEKRRNELQCRVDANLQWAGNYDTDIGPFEDKYKAMTGDIGTLYEKAKDKHRAGIEVLKKEFNYHPGEHRRPHETFK
jgi:hypothetical protein